MECCSSEDWRSNVECTYLPDAAVEVELLELGKEMYRNYLQEGGMYATFEVIKSDAAERRVIKNNLAGRSCLTCR